MAKCDLKWAYRSMPIKPDHYQLTGLQWTFKGDRTPTTLMDTAFPFGARKSPAFFNRITKAVKRMMIRRGYNCTVFLDDFLLYEQTFEKCKTALSVLITLLRSLGFRINWRKVNDPCKRLVFLGIEIDIESGMLKLDPEKQDNLVKLIKDIANRKRISKHKLQVLGGKCTWASNVIRHARAHMNSFFHAVRRLNHNDHKMRLTTELRTDLQWWVENLQKQRPTRYIWPALQQQQQPKIHIATDASLIAGGAFLRPGNAWIYRNWLLDKPSIANSNITIKELAMINEAIQTWAPLHPNHHFYIECDNMAAVHMTNSGATRHHIAAQLLRCITDRAQQHNITITATHIQGEMNEIPDSISRLHTPGQMLRLSSLLHHLYYPSPHPTFCLLNHMSYFSSLFLMPQVINYHKKLPVRHIYSTREPP